MSFFRKNVPMYESRAGGYDSTTGLYATSQVVPSPVDLLCSIQPAPGEAVLKLPENRKNREVLQVITAQALQLPDVGQIGVIISWKNKLYEIFTRQDWQNDLLNHYVYLASQIDAQILPTDTNITLAVSIEGSGQFNAALKEVVVFPAQQYSTQGSIAANLSNTIAFAPSFSGVGSFEAFLRAEGGSIIELSASILGVGGLSVVLATIAALGGAAQGVGGMAAGLSEAVAISPVYLGIGRFTASLKERLALAASYLGVATVAANIEAVEGSGGYTNPWIQQGDAEYYWDALDETIAYNTTTNNVVNQLTNLIPGKTVTLTSSGSNTPTWTSADAKFGGSLFPQFTVDDFMSFSAPVLPLGNQDFTVVIAYVRTSGGSPLFGHGNGSVGSTNNCVFMEIGFSTSNIKYGALNEPRSPGFPSSFNDELIWAMRYDAATRTFTLKEIGQESSGTNVDRDDSYTLTSDLVLAAGEEYRIGDINGLADFLEARVYGISIHSKRLSDAELAAGINYWRGESKFDF